MKIEELKKLSEVLRPRMDPEVRLLVDGLFSLLESQAAIIEKQSQELLLQGLRIKELEDQLSKNSSNSSKPPSSDSPFEQKLKARRKKGMRKAGGQKGHKGSTLKMVAVPDKIAVHALDSCRECGKSLKRVSALGHARAQVYDLPQIKMEVVEHQAEIKCCPDCQCQVVADFPTHVSASVQYGPNLKSLLSYWHNYQMLPYARSVEMVRDLTGHSLSTGTLYNTQAYVYKSLENFDTELTTLLAKENLAHFDETGANISAKLNWVHICTTQTHAHFALHAKRGREAMEDIGILPHFSGNAVHDFWDSYFHFNCDHAACNAHLLRELKFIHERYDQDWAEKMANLLLRIKKAVEKAKERGETQLRRNLQTRFQNQYDKILDQGLAINPQPPPSGKRGRTKKSKVLNLLIRFRDWESAILRFMYEFEVPFDNNLAERNLRMLKVKLKISGCFRSSKGAQYFLRIRAFIITARMQGISAFEAIKQLFLNPNEIQERLILAK